MDFCRPAPIVQLCDQLCDGWAKMFFCWWLEVYVDTTDCFGTGEFLQKQYGEMEHGTWNTEHGTRNMEHVIS